MKAAYTLVGMKHRNAEAFVAALTAGEPVKLIREPDNPHDQNAVQVWTRDMHIGYVKGTQARKLARFMDRDCAGGPVMGKMAFGGDRWPMVEVEE